MEELAHVRTMLGESVPFGRLPDVVQRRGMTEHFTVKRGLRQLPFGAEHSGPCALLPKNLTLMNKIHPSSHYYVRYARDEDTDTLLAARYMSESYKEYVQVELDIMRSLGRHPHVNRPLCYEEGVSIAGERMCLMLYPLAHGSLDTFLVRSAALPLEYLRRADVVVTQLAAGLRAIHAAGVVHRDLKPANILVFDGCLKLADFSSAGYAEDFQGPDICVKRVLPYSAPEELLHHESVDGDLEPLDEDDHEVMFLDTKPDIYALGVVCLHYLVIPGDALLGLDGAHRRYVQDLKAPTALTMSLVENSIGRDARLSVTHVGSETDFSELFFSVFADQRHFVSSHTFSDLIYARKRAEVELPFATITAVANMLRLSPEHRHL